jgi:hypothetical protein
VAFIRSCLFLFLPSLLLSFVLSLVLELDIGLRGIMLLAIVFCAITAALIAWFSDKMGSMASVIYTGYRQRSAKEQHSGNLTRARHLKSEKMYAEALALVDEYLECVPREAEGLFLKAQILIASAGDLNLARRCLASIVSEAPPEDPFHRWAKELMLKMGH